MGGAGYGASLAISLVSANREAMLSKFEDAFSKYETWAKMTPWELKQTDIDKWEHKEFGEASTLEQGRYLLYYVMMPGLRSVGERAHRYRAEVEGLMTVISMLRYNKAKGQYPESLNEVLEAGLLKKLPMDPFSDKPLVYRRMDDGFTLYSVSYNSTDDGGMVIMDRKGRVGMWASRGDAVFWPID